MPKNGADRAIMFSVIGLVAWAIIGLPLFNSFSKASHRPAPTDQHSANKAETEEPWLTKDAAGFFTFMLFVVGGIQAALFIWQLWLIRESLSDAKAAADAAKIQAETGRATLESMQQTAQQQLRAYVSMSPVLFGGLFGGNIRITFEVRNHGKTPAFEIRHESSIDVFDNPLPNNFQFPPPKVPADGKMTLFPEATFESRFFNSLPHLAWELGDVAANRRRIYCWGRIQYRDAFNVWRETNFCASAGGMDFIADQIAYLDGEKGPSWGWDYGPAHNHST